MVAELPKLYPELQLPILSKERMGFLFLMGNCRIPRQNARWGKDRKEVRREVFVNEELLRLGYAHIQRPLVAKYRDRLLRAQEAARGEGLGIWAKTAEQNIAITKAHADAEGNDRDNLCNEYIVTVKITQKLKKNSSILS